MDKIIERVARAIEESSDYNPQYDVHEFYRGDVLPNSKAVAQTAIEALDIIILPADAEPEVGDRVIFNSNIEDFICCGFVDGGRIYEYEDASGSFLHIKDVTDIEIIQRQGKPVIMESE